ncbi:MAG: hypothetical protein Q8M11_19355 [Sulfuritalea sp.]|nr:hypothetical protein [Sulfuritalea sp.]MDP1982177.1 hypothetical protein [Sulfuritalea sp.]
MRPLPLFPDPGPPLPAFTADDTATFADWEAHRRQGFEQLLGFWGKLSMTYAAILSAEYEGAAHDGLKLTATIEDWPSTFDAQQRALTGLMDESKLRLAWRSMVGWQLTQRTYFTDGQRAVSTALEREHADSARPMREIPLYWHGLRTACQQVICMPVRMWDAMFADSAHYEPGSVDGAVVDRLATRMAAALNAPFAPSGSTTPASHYGSDHPWPRRSDDLTAPVAPIVWHTDPRSLLCQIDGHGMQDRLFDDYLRPLECEPGRMPTWRFDGFCGRLRVAGIGDEPWYVTVLASAHFVRTLSDIVREGPQ